MIWHLSRMMKNVFVYGSLMFDDVWNRIAGRRYEKHTALLKGYRRLCVKGETYPGLVKSFNCSVEGVVYLDVTAQDIRRLDRFEGDYYRRISVAVSSETGDMLDAEVYLFSKQSRHLLSTLPWNPVRFQMLHLRRFITRYRGF
jgi:gamma-glutamylcyclotransferase (GGCT)/AIG2-like uncharacterized protein YtfP